MKNTGKTLGVQFRLVINQGTSNKKGKKCWYFPSKTIEKKQLN